MKKLSDVLTFIYAFEKAKEILKQLLRDRWPTSLKITDGATAYPNSFYLITDPELSEKIKTLILAHYKEKKEALAKELKILGIDVES